MHFFSRFFAHLVHLHGVRIKVNDFEDLVLGPWLEAAFVTLER